MRGEKAGFGVTKELVHKTWTKEPFPDDFDDSDLD